MISCFLAEMGWVIFFMISCLFFFEQGLKERKKDLKMLRQRLHDLYKEREGQRVLQKKLLLQKKSQKDPLWVEMLLKKGLGLVSKRQIKVFFVTQE